MLHAVTCFTAGLGPLPICHVQQLECICRLETGSDPIRKAKRDPCHWSIPNRTRKVLWQNIKLCHINIVSFKKINEHFRPRYVGPCECKQQSWDDSTNSQKADATIAVCSTNSSFCRRVRHKNFTNHQKTKPNRIDEGKAERCEACQGWLATTQADPIFKGFAVVQKYGAP